MTRVSIVLGAGGPVGHAFHAGVLQALERELGLDARDATLVVGTSAGAQVAALIRAGMSAADLGARVRGRPLSPAGREIAKHYVRPSHELPPRSERPPWRPGSLRYLSAVVRRPWRARPGRLVSALVPDGPVSLEPQAAGFRALFGDRWPERELWIPAVCRDTGERVAFGSGSAPSTDVGTAVAASGAVPGVCRSVVIGGRRFVDGGIASAAHLDLCAASEEDVIFVSNPLSIFPPLRLLLRREVRALRPADKTVVLFEPSADAASVMGLDVMDVERAAPTVEAAREAATKALRSRKLKQLVGSLF
ncbi:MAG: patatin-like phospholipase family protein [Myxococcota bacterium]|nr:patatin-like phospholipase family protein [Myxococcota bacterium]